MDDEQSVHVYVPLSDDTAERARFVELQEQLEATVERAGAGELEGDEWGGFCCIILYGTNVDAILSSIRPVLEKARLPEGSYIVRRSGPGGQETKEMIA